ncbi:MAG: hypothetical protein ABIG66_04525 [Candidatus Kerfeldbacteria bacterium]
MKTKLFTISILLASVALVGQSCGSVADGGIFISSDVGEQWEQKVYIGQEGRKTVTIGGVDVVTIEVDPKLPGNVYVGTKEDGLFKSDSKGESWWQLGIAPDKIRDVAVNPVDSGIVYTIRGSDIIKSADFGNNWEIVYTDTQGALITRIAIDWFKPDRIFATTSIGTILLSEDNGANWRVLYQVDEPILGFLISYEDSRVLYVLELDKAIHKSTDGGNTWVNLYNEEFDADFHRAAQVKTFAMDANNADTLYATSKEGLIKTTNGGGNWEFVNTLIERGADENAAISAVTTIPGQPDTLIFAVGRIIHKSIDGGRTWKTIENFPSQRSITYMVVDPEDPNRLIAGVEQPEKEQRGLIQ